MATTEYENDLRRKIKMNGRKNAAAPGEPGSMATVMDMSRGRNAHFTGVGQPAPTGYGGTQIPNRPQPQIAPRVAAPPGQVSPVGDTPQPVVPRQAPPQPAAAPGGMVGPPKPGAEDAQIAAAKERVRESEYRRMINSRHMRLLESDSIGEFGGDNEARIRAIQAAAMERARANGAVAPVQREMTGDEIQDGRTSLNQQMKGLAEGQRTEADRLYKTGAEGDLAKGDAAAAEFGRLNRAADTSFGPIAPDELAMRTKLQDEARKRQIATRLANQEMSAEGQGRYEAGIEGDRAHETTLKESIRSGQIAKVRGEAAPARIAHAEAELAGNPDAIQAQIDSIKNQGKIRAATERGQLAQAEGESAGAERGGHMAQVGIDDRFYNAANKFEAGMRDRIGSFFSGSAVTSNLTGAGLSGDLQALDSYGSLVVSRIEDLAKVNPQEASHLATERLTAMPPPDSSGGYGVGGAIQSGGRNVYAAKIKSLWDRLMRIANPPSEGPLAQSN